MLQQVVHVVRHCAALLALLVGGLLPAQAAIYAGAWDPAFGDAFPDLGWRGEARFYLPDACLAEDGWVLNTDACSAEQMSLLGAEVIFYSLSDPTNPALQETLLFDVASSAVVAMELEDGMLTAVLGSFVYSRPSTLPLAGAPDTDFVLFFEERLARLSYLLFPPGVPPIWGVSDSNPPDGAPFITFRRVPEPGTGLALVGILALVALRRPRIARHRTTASSLRLSALRTAVSTSQPAPSLLQSS